MPYKPNKPFPPSPRELIVVARPEARLRVTDKGVVVSQTNFDVKFLNELLSKPGRRLSSLFRPSKKLPKRRDDGQRTKYDVAPPDLSVYFRLFAPNGELELLARQLSGHPAIGAAYVKPGAVPPVWHTCAIKEDEPPELYRSVNASEDVIASASGDVVASGLRSPSEFTQGYLGDPPEGIGARYVWENYQGADGEGVKIIDIEGGWHFTHQDLLVNQDRLVGGTLDNDPDWTKHGTAVLGILGGDENDFGITGICPEAFVAAVSNINTDIEDAWGTATAIQHAADQLGPGDIILIELQQPGPAAYFEHNDAQIGYIPVEWWDDNLRAIQYATNKGVIVVEAGANGDEDLDDAIYDDGPFVSPWRNPFRRTPPNDSGAIIVGAGAPPAGTHGRTSQRDRSRLTFSNYGSMFDAQGWGTQVETCGGASEVNLGGTNQDLRYTKFFSGTSSAAAMVAGALGCIQGARKGAGLPPLTPREARELLRCKWLGSPQEGVSGSGPDVSKRIGSRPNLIKMITAVV